LLLAGLFGFLVTVILKKQAELQLLVDEQAAVGIAYADSFSTYFVEIND
jgi:hypothetical protein